MEFDGLLFFWGLAWFVGDDRFGALGVSTSATEYLPYTGGAIARHEMAQQLGNPVHTKSSIMVGLGEERHEVLQVMDDLRSAEVDFLTIGQYLQPTRKHHPVVRFVTPEEFKSYETVAGAKGFLLVSASPLTRSSHHAGEDFAKLKAARLART